MIYIKSCGFVVYKELNDKRLYLIIRTSNGEYGFRRKIEYKFPNKEDVIKIAVYFIGKCIKDDIVCQETEILEAMFVPIETALELLSFDDTKRVLKEADGYISSLSNCSK